MVNTEEQQVEKEAPATNDADSSAVGRRRFRKRDVVMLPLRVAKLPVRAAMMPVRAAMWPVRVAARPFRLPIRVATMPVRAMYTLTSNTTNSIIQMYKFIIGAQWMIVKKTFNAFTLSLWNMLNILRRILVNILTRLAKKLEPAPEPEPKAPAAPAVSEPAK
jgi:hypothetical protein